MRGESRPMRSILWFRHGLRLHDNPSLHAALEPDENGQPPELIPLFIFDGETAGTKLCGYNRFQFLLECLHDLDTRFRSAPGGKLHLLKGDPVSILSMLMATLPGGFDRICFEQDCEPIWKRRDHEVIKWCKANGVEWVEKVGHTLYDPYDVIQVNGGKPPLTFNIFNHVTQCMELPAKPKPDVDLMQVSFADLSSIEDQLSYFNDFPSPENFGYTNDGTYSKVYIGGETEALRHFELRLKHEKEAFIHGSYMPNRRDPDILCPPKSLSPDFRFGSLSVRKFYWAMMDAFEDTKRVAPENSGKVASMIVGQLLWREFFYTMSVNNDYYGRMEGNPYCIQVPWYGDMQNANWIAFKEGRTGYPFIDAGMRQLIREGWAHHVVRNALATFLTRGDLWISWEDGLSIFLEYLLDGDWSVCAGNWMWVSSSAFDKVLNCSNCIDPGTVGRRSDPWGEYVRRYIPELAQMPVEYIYQPWKAPIDVQEAAGCIIGRDYPDPIVIHEKVSRDNALKMCSLRQELQRQMMARKQFCGPSDEIEAREFMRFESTCQTHGDLNV